MTLQTRWWLPMVMAGSLVMACGSSGGGGGTTTPDASTTDAPMTDATTDMGTPTDAPTDRPADRADVATDRTSPAAAACASATDISSMTPGSDGAIHVMGDNSSGAPVQIGSLPDGCPLNTSGGDQGYKGNVVVYRYTMRSAGLLRVSTNNPGTEDGFDTVVAVLSACTASANSLACNDDVGGGNFTSTATTTTSLMMGQSVFIVVGGWGTDPAKGATGAFELTVAETAPTPVGGPCMAGTVCVANAVCIPNIGSTTMGTCLANGASRGLCRTSGTACDTGLQCTVEMPSEDAPGQCLTPAMVGQPCGQLGVCVMNSVCPNILIGGASTGDAGVSDAGTSTMDGGTMPAVTRRCVAPVPEVEPNNTPAMPQATVTSSTVFHGALTAGDTDCYSVTVPAGTTIYAETSDANGTCDLGEGGDTVLRVYRQGESAVLAENDDISSSNVCSRLNGASTAALARVAAGTYSVCVTGYAAPDASAGPIMSYYLTIGLTP